MEAQIQRRVAPWWTLGAIVALAALSFFAVWRRPDARAGRSSGPDPASTKSISRDAGAFEPGHVLSQRNSDAGSGIEARWAELHDRWLEALDWQGGWLYVARVIEYEGDLGTDPETGRPLPNRSLWEEWFLRENGQDRVQRSLLQRTDLDLGNVWAYSWTEEVYVSHITGAHIPDQSPSTFDPSASLGCFSALDDFSGQIRSAEWREQDGVSLYEVTIRKVYPAPVRGVDDDPRTFVASETRCSRDAETGAPVRIERVAITDAGERVLRDRVYDYQVHAGETPPAQLLSLFAQR